MRADDTISGKRKVNIGELNFEESYLCEKDGDEMASNVQC